MMSAKNSDHIVGSDEVGFRTGPLDRNEQGLLVLNAMTRAYGSMRSMKRIQPRPVAAVTGARDRKAWKVVG